MIKVTHMKAAKEPATPVVVPTKILKGKDGREPFADKNAQAKQFLEKHPLPDFITKR